MKQITINPNNEPYYSEDFIKGFKCGAERQLDADEADRPQGKWKAKTFHECICDNCGFSFDIMKCDFLENMKFCPNCGARMKGEA
jgi:membrane protease subunit (stomatin/prohibitin family)